MILLTAIDPMVMAPVSKLIPQSPKVFDPVILLTAMDPIVIEPFEKSILQLFPKDFVPVILVAAIEPMVIEPVSKSMPQSPRVLDPLIRLTLSSTDSPNVTLDPLNITPFAPPN